MSYLLCAANLY